MNTYVLCPTRLRNHPYSSPDVTTAGGMTRLMRMVRERSFSNDRYHPGPGCEERCGRV